MDAFLLGLEHISHTQILLALLIGAIAGIVVGAIPGLEPAGAMAIVLPFSLQLEPLAGITILLGCYGGAWYGGAIPAILIKVPGTPVNVLTTYDGYPMAKRGEAHRALSLAYSSSFIGGICSVLALIFLAPYLATFAENFGPTEYAAIAVMALSSVVLAHYNQLPAAVMSLGLGMFCGAIGRDDVFNTQRYSFGEQWLIGGIPMVPVVIGLFAMSQGFVLLTSKPNEKGLGDIDFRNRFRGLVEAVKYYRTLVRSIFIGLTMGLLPGVGEFGAQFLSYSLAKRFSKKPQEFGKGSAEGLVASESSISACTSTVLVPLLALGMPSDPLMAMVLTVFMIHNIVPGPRLFAEHPDLVSGLYISLFLLNIIVLTILLFATKYITRLSRIDPRFIGASVLVLSMIGTYTQNYRVTDALIAVFFAIVGRIFIRNDIPAFPLVIGLVLGPLLEWRFAQAMSLSNGNLLTFFERPVSAGILIAVGIAYAAFFYTTFRGRNRAAS
jgi:putative tricarboxylic transport membrane protein